MQPVHTGVSIAGRHDDGKSLLSPVKALGRWTRYGNILLPLNDARVLVTNLLRMMMAVNFSGVPDPLPLTASPSDLLKTAPYSPSKRVLVS